MEIFSNDSVCIADSVKTHLNSWEKKPSAFDLESITKDPPAMMIQQLAGAQIKTQYINGSYIGIWNFAVYCRIPGEDTAERLDATGCLYELAEWLTQKDDNGKFSNLPEIDSCRTVTKISLTSVPALAERFQDGTEDYQAIFSLEYKYRRN